MQVKRQQLELDMELQIGSKLGKEYLKNAFVIFQLGIYIYLLIKYREQKYLSFSSALIMLRFSRLLYFAGCCTHAQLCPNLCDPWTVALQAPVSMGFSRQEEH